MPKEMFTINKLRKVSYHTLRNLKNHKINKSKEGIKP